MRRRVQLIFQDPIASLIHAADQRHRCRAAEIAGVRSERNTRTVARCWRGP
jgi:hypothetical protein